MDTGFNQSHQTDGVHRRKYEYYACINYLQSSVLSLSLMNRREVIENMHCRTRGRAEHTPKRNKIFMANYRFGGDRLNCEDIREENV